VTVARAAARIVPSLSTGGDGAVEPTFDDVRAAAHRLDGVARRTPLEHSDALSEIAGTAVHLKLEGLQRTGSFKLRGAWNFVSTLPVAARAGGVVTASAGNHGMGVALSARLEGIGATVFVPADAAETKRRRIARLGADLRLVDGGYDDAHGAAEAFAAETGAPFVNAFSDPVVVAGQGTVGLEIFADLPAVRTVIVPAGGGGLIGGIGVVARALGDGVRVIGVQTVETAALHASLAAGRPTSATYGPTLCEGLSGDIDERAFRLASQVVDEVVLVSEDAVRRAIRWLYVEESIVAEGSAAVGVAALLAGAIGDIDGPVAVVVSGSNLDAARLASILSGS
jgi:threonine dehydratase